MKAILLPTMLVSILAVPAATAAVVSYDFSGPTLTPSVTAPHATASPLGLKVPAWGLVSLAVGRAAPAAAAAGWNGPADSQAFSFAVVADPGYSLALTGLSFDNFSIDPPDPILTRNGPKSFDVRVNGMLVSSANATSINAWDTITIPFLFSGSSALIEIAGYGGTAGMAVTAGWAIDNVTLTGSVIPGPATGGLFGALALVGYAAGRRRLSPPARPQL